MSSSLKFIAELMVLFLFTCIIYDYARIHMSKEIIKNTLDLSTKAAALQIDENPDKIGQGVFEIDVAKAKKVNEQIFRENTSEEFYNYVVKTDVVNVHSPQYYTAPNGKKYLISDPTVFCVVKYKYDGLILDKNITVNILSGSVLKNKNDI